MGGLISTEDYREGAAGAFYDTSFRHTVETSFIGGRILVDGRAVPVVVSGDLMRIGCTTVTRRALQKLLDKFKGQE